MNPQHAKHQANTKDSAEDLHCCNYVHYMVMNLRPSYSRIIQFFSSQDGILRAEPWATESSFPSLYLFFCKRIIVLLMYIYTQILERQKAKN